MRVAAAMALYFVIMFGFGFLLGPIRAGTINHRRIGASKASDTRLMITP
jgi:hypothetical protein